MHVENKRNLNIGYARRKQGWQIGGAMSGIEENIGAKTWSDLQEKPKGTSIIVAC